MSLWSTMLLQINEIFCLILRFCIEEKDFLWYNRKDLISGSGGTKNERANEREADCEYD